MTAREEIEALKATMKSETPFSDGTVSPPGVLYYLSPEGPMVVGGKSGHMLELTIPDVHFGAIPHTISSRGDYVKVKLSGEADDYEVTLS